MLKTTPGAACTITVSLTICLGALVACGLGRKAKEDIVEARQRAARRGEALVQKVNAVKGANFGPKCKFKNQSQSVAAFGKSGLELSIVEEGGVEIGYTRGGEGDLAHTSVARSEGNHFVIIKNNSSAAAEIESCTLSGATGLDELDNFLARGSSIYKDYTLKAYVGFARECLKTKADGSGVDVVQAPVGRYFPQPIVFLGKVANDRTVADVTSAQITLVAGDDVVTLKRLDELDFAAYRGEGRLAATEQARYTKLFYQGYLGAAGEMYTVDTFAKGGDCNAAKTIALGTDPGATPVALKVKDATTAPAIDELIPVRATVSTAFSTYENNTTKLQDYTQCTYNKTTGEPTTYNGSAGECKTFSISNPPYVTLDYKLPSQTGGAVTTSASDPTRILFYGHSLAKEFYAKLIADSASLNSGASSGIALSGCLNSGGMIGVPISESKTYLPLKEFNAAKNDVISLARKTGAYTSLVKFYQGNIVAKGTVQFPTCIPSGTTSCASFKTLAVTIDNCEIKADSGVAVSSISDRMVYPDSFEMSGIIVE